MLHRPRRDARPRGQRDNPHSAASAGRLRLTPYAAVVATPRAPSASAPVNERAARSVPDFELRLRGRDTELTAVGESLDRLLAGQGTVIPKGTMHRPRAPQRTVILMVETKTIVPTGS